MWGYAILGLLFFSVFFIYYENKQRTVFRKYSEKIILSNAGVLADDFIFENVQNSTNIYKFIEIEKLLKSVTKDVSDIKLNELGFSNFQTFKDYVKSKNPSTKIFTHIKTMYLFYPILNEENDFQFIVFEKEKLIFDDLMGFKTKRYNY